MTYDAGKIVADSVDDVKRELQGIAGRLETLEAVVGDLMGDLLKAQQETATALQYIGTVLFQRFMWETAPAVLAGNPVEDPKQPGTLLEDEKRLAVMTEILLRKVPTPPWESQTERSQHGEDT